MEPLVIDSLNRLDGARGFAVVVFVHLGLPLALAAVAWARASLAKGRAELAAREGRDNPNLEPGLVAIFGPVEHEPGSTVALRVEIHQKGRERRTKNGWSHTWTETSRKTSAAPFYVRDARGRVRVEPDDRTLLIDKLDKTIRTAAAPEAPSHRARKDEPTRTRVSELTPGEKVHVLGELVAGGAPAGPYRNASSEPAVRAPRGRRLLCSVEPFADRFERSARRERWSVRAFLIMAAALVLFDVGYYLRVAFGERQRAQIVETRYISGKNPRCELTLVTETGDRFTDDVTQRTCKSLGIAREVWVISPGTGGWFAHVGTSPGLNIGAFVFGGLVVMVGTALYLFRNKEWYEAKVTDYGTGRLGR